MYQKRGQVTVFIIIGIVILFVVALVLYFQGEELQLPSERVPDEFKPVQNYVQLCVQGLAARSVLLLGSQAGYTEVPERITNDPSAFLEPVTGGVVKIPHWYHRGELRIPSREAMEFQIAQYVDENMMSCLNEFQALEGYEIAVLNNVSTTARVEAETVTVITELPLQVKVKGTDKQMILKEYNSQLEVPLQDMYDLAKTIMEKENEDLFFENLTINLMALGPDIPITGLEFSCGQKTWQKKHVEDYLKNILFYNLPRVVVKDTDHLPLTDRYQKLHMLWDVEEDHPEMIVSFQYLKDWPFDMRVRPSRGDVMTASFGKGSAKYLSYLCMNLYHFTYDVVYPLQVTITDPEALNGYGYSFTFTFPVLIDHNAGKRKDFDFSIYDLPLINTDVCRDKRNQDFLVTAKDKTTLMDVKDVNLTFSCMRTYDCYLGKTGFTANTYALSTRLPDFCTPGTIKAEHNNYVKTEQAITDDRSMELLMTPLKHLPLTIEKVRLTSGVMQDPEPLENGEKAVVFIRTDATEDYIESREFPVQEDDEPYSSPTEASYQLPLIVENVTYDVTMFLTDDDERLIGGFRGNWTPNPTEVRDAGGVTLRVIEVVPHPVNEEKQAEMLLNLQKKDYSYLHKFR